MKRRLASVHRQSIQCFFLHWSTLDWLIYTWLTVIVYMHSTVAATLKFVHGKKQTITVTKIHTKVNWWKYKRKYRFDWVFMGQRWCVRIIWWMKGRFMSRRRRVPVTRIRSIQPLITLHYIVCKFSNESLILLINTCDMCYSEFFFHSLLHIDLISAASP